MVIAHWHHFAVINNDTIITPPLIGTNQYSFNRLHAISPAESLLFFTTAKNNLGIVNMQLIKYNKTFKSHFKSILQEAYMPKKIKPEKIKESLTHSIEIVALAYALGKGIKKIIKLFKRR